MTDLYQKTRRLWVAFFPPNPSPNTGDELTRLLKHTPQQEPLTLETTQATGHLMNSFSDGPFPLAAFSETLSVKLKELLPEEGVARAMIELQKLSQDLNHLMFERMASLSGEHFAAGQLDEVLAFVEGPLWRPKGLSAELAEFNDNLERWQTERVLPLIEGYQAHLRQQAPPPILPTIEADDPLVIRLVKAKGLDPDMKQTITAHLKSWEQQGSTALIRERGLWPAMTQQLLDDPFWRRTLLVSYRATWTEAELHELVSFYESPSGQQLNTIMSKWNESNQGFMGGEAFQAKFSEWLQKVTE